MTMDTLTLDVPFEITDGISLSNSLDILGVFGVSSELTETKAGIMALSVPLSDGLSDVFVLAVPVGVYSGLWQIKIEMPQAVTGQFTVNNTIGDFGLSGVFELSASMPEHGISSAFRLRNGIGGRDNNVLTQTCTITIDGFDVSDLLSSATLNLYGDSAIADIELNLALKDNMFRDGSEIIALIEGDEYGFIAEETEQTADSLRIWGRAKIAELYEPYAEKQDYAFSAGDGKDLAETISVAVLWLADSYQIGAFGGAMYPMDALQKIAEACGNEVRGLDSAYVVNPFEIEGYISIDNVLEKTVSRSADIYDAVRVTLSGDDLLIIDSEDTEAEVNKTVDVRIYSSAGYKLKTDGFNNMLVRSKVRETITEDVQLTDGAGSLKYPVVRVLTEGITVYGQKIYAAGCRYISVSYETEYDLWQVWSSEPMTGLVCIAETENTVLAGAGARVLAADNELVTTTKTAEAFAKYTLNSNSGRTAKFKIAYMPELATLLPSGVRHNDFTGIITGLSVNIESNPLQIYHTLEVREYGG